MSLNPNGTKNYNWNYSNPNKPNYTQVLIGTVVAIQEVQKRAFSNNGKPGAPMFWPEGNPMMNHRIALATQNGELVSFTYQPASKDQKKDKTGIHMALYALTGETDMMNLVGKTIKLSTQDAGINPATGQPIKYGTGNPRPFWVEEVEGGPYQLNAPLPAEFTVPELLCNDAVSGGQLQQAYQPQPVQQQPMQQVQQVQQFVPPTIAVPQVNTAQVIAQQQPMQQAQPMVQQPEGVINPMQPAMPAGMDPQVAAAMQAVGASNVQPVNDPYSVYDEDIPFA